VAPQKNEQKITRKTAFEVRFEAFLRPSVPRLSASAFSSARVPHKMCQTMFFHASAQREQKKNLTFFLRVLPEFFGSFDAPSL